MGGAIAEGNMTPGGRVQRLGRPRGGGGRLRRGRRRDDDRARRHPPGGDGPEVQRRLAATGRIGTFVADLVEFFTVYHRETYGWDGAPIHDAVAVAHLIRPDLVTTRLRNVEVELESELCRGRTVVDLWLRTERPKNVHVGVELDTAGFFDLLVERIGRLEG